MRKPDIKSALIAAAVVFTTATTFASIEFKSGGAMLRLTDANGAVESLVADGAERVVPAAEAFTIQLLDGKGEPTLLKSTEFVFEGLSRVEHVERVGVWRHANGLVVRMEVAAADGEFRFTPSVEGIPAGMLLEWFDGPQVCISPDRKLFWPEWDGIEVTKFAHPYHPVGYRERFSNDRSKSFYPGLAQMQCMAAYKDGKGVYFSAVDTRHTPKAVDWEELGD